MKTIAFLNQSLSFGGAEKMMSFVIGSVAPMFDELYLIQFTKPGSDYDLPENVKFVSVGEDIDNPSFINKLILFIKRIVRTKHILKTQHIDVLCSFGYYFTLMSVLSVMGTTTKIIASERRSPEDNGLIWRLISKVCYGRCEKIVFQLQKASDYFTNIRDSKKRIIPNPYFSKERNLVYNHEDTRKEIVMAAARLEYVKGFDIGIRAMTLIVKKHPEYKLIIYGKGDYEGSYSELIKECGMDEYVEYRGHSKQIIKDMLRSEIFLLPSRLEGIPNMLLEAMGCGMPCVATDCRPGGARLLLGNNEYGFLVGYEDVEGVANSIIKLIEDPILAQEMSKKAMLVRERFSEDIIAEQWRECFKEVI